VDPKIDEFCRAHELRTEWFRSFQRYLRDVISPQLDKVEPLELENEKLREELAVLRQAAPVKRGPGRPRKVQSEAVGV
jgi:hypothetical protein